MSDPLATNDNDPGAQKRRSTRISQAVPITVTGVDALGQPFKERTTTVMVNCHGCKYQSKHYVPKNSVVTLEVARQEAGLSPRSIAGRVIWVQRPRTVRELFQIGLEFEVHGNVWGIAFPPEDWFPCPGEPEASPASEASSPAAAVPKNPEPQSNVPQRSTSAPLVTPPPAAVASPTAHPPAKPVAPPSSSSVAPSVAPPVAPVPPPASKIHLVPAAEPSQDAQQAIQLAAQQAAQAAAQGQIAKLLADAKETIGKTARQDAQAAVNDEMTVVRQQLDAQLHDAVERAIKVSMERASDSAAKKLVQQAAERTNAIVEEARKGAQATAGQLDAKIRQAVDEAVSGAAERAAQQAAQLATTQNLQSSVEESVARVIAEREAASPSLNILSSPEAAQQHLDQWKKTLEETAHGVRQATSQQSQADAEAAARRLHEELEAAINGASQKLGTQLDQVSRAKLGEAEADAAARVAGILSSLDGAVSGSKAQIAEAEAAATASVRSSLEEAVAASQTSISGMEEDAATRMAGLRSSLEEAVAASQISIAGIEEDAAARVAGLRSSLDETVAGSKAAIQSLHSGLEQERARAGEIQSQLADAAQAAVNRARSGLDELLNAQSNEIARKADGIIAERTALVAPAIENSAQEALGRFTQEIDRALAPKIDEAGRMAFELSQAGRQAAAAGQEVRTQIERLTERAAQVGSGLHEQIRTASEQAIAESLGRVRDEAAKVPAEVEQTCRAVVSRVEAELERKTTEAQHETFESLTKAADWYQKKAQTTMQASLEKAVDQSAANLRDRAAEISSLVSTELDHHRRAYAEHSRAEIEETANEIVTRERGRLSESAAMVNAGFADEVQRVAAESLRRFQEVSREALEKSRSDMEFNREGALGDFQNALERQMAAGVEQARIHLESRLAPLVETWEARRSEQQRQWMELLRRSTNESIEGYKTRLENATNSWLLASATTLGQNSQAILDTLAKSAEKRLRETCSDVLAGIGDTIKDRLMGISTGFSKDEEEDDPPSSPPKK